mgnify:CR=1 FL=1
MNTKFLTQFFFLEVAALSQAVESGLGQLREMGILAQTTEAEARRILQENGGNVQAAVNRILGMDL